jgi:hypothetical protein
MTLDDLRLFLFNHPPPYHFTLSDGGRFTVDDPDFLILPPLGSLCQQCVLFGRNKKGLILFDVDMITSLKAGKTPASDPSPPSNP